MANTVKIAKNTFAEGLIMDFAPDSSSSNSLSSALNATFITFNGNEMSLLNDMGNGRVETARLPDGYVPVGTCEFGDIIYIVSYNPLINKCLIGCFPSPERNISSEEVGNTALTIKASDFLELSEGKPTGKLKAHSAKYILYQKTLNPGDKYIIYTEDLNAINGENSKTITDIGNTSHIPGTLPRLMRLHVVSIEDSGKITYLDTSVKWYNKGGQLDYFILSSDNGNYNNAVGKVDLDSYRSLVSSAYSIFNSKVSGKLAILAELEEINGFSCTYDIYSKTNNDNTKDHSIYFDFSWETENPDTNPAYIVLTESNWVGIPQVYYNGELDTSINLSNTINSLKAWSSSNPTDCWNAKISQPSYPTARNNNYQGYQYIIDNLKKDELILTLALDSTTNKPIIGYYYKNVKSVKNNNGSFIYLNKEGDPITAKPIDDSIVNNYYHSSILKEFHTFLNIPYLKIIKGNPDKIQKAYIENGIYHYQIAPAMEYGILELYAIDGYIDLNKINSGDIALTGWRYYNTENNSTLTFEIEAYPELHKGISEVVLEFYDNQGFAAAYHIRNRKSYSGTFTEYIPLNGEQLDYKLDYIKADGTIGTHLGLPVNKNDYENWNNNKGDSKYKEYIKSNLFPDYGPYFKNDAGILYSGIVYLVKVIVKYCSKDALGNYKDDYNLNKEFKNTTFYRWMWTNTLFNDRYYDTRDYDSLPFLLSIDLLAKYTEGSDYKYKVYNYKPKSYTPGDPSKNMCATVLHLTGSIDVSFDACLMNTYGSFLLNANSIYGKNEGYGIDIRLYNGGTYIENTPEIVDCIHTENILSNNLPGILPIVDTKMEWYRINNDLAVDDLPTYNAKWGPLLCTLLGISLNYKKEEGKELEVYKELWEDSSEYKNGTYMEVAEANTSLTEDDKESIYYIPIKGEEALLLQNLKYKARTLTDLFKININSIHFSKYYHEVYYVSIEANSLYPVIRNTDDLTTYSLHYLPDDPNKPDEGGHIYLDTGLGWVMQSDGKGGKTNKAKFAKETTDDVLLKFPNEISNKFERKCSLGDTWSQFSGNTAKGIDGSTRIGSIKDIDPDMWDNIMGDTKFMAVSYAYTDLSEWRTDNDVNRFSATNTKATYKNKVESLVLDSFHKNVLSVNNVNLTTKAASFFNTKGGTSSNGVKASNVGNYCYDVHSEGNAVMLLGFNGDTNDNFHMLNNVFPLTYNTSGYNQYFNLATDTSQKEAKYYTGCDYIITYCIMTIDTTLYLLLWYDSFTNLTMVRYIPANEIQMGNITTEAEYKNILNYVNKSDKYRVYVTISPKSNPQYILIYGYTNLDLIKLGYLNIDLNNYGAPSIFTSKDTWNGPIFKMMGPIQPGTGCENYNNDTITKIDFRNTLFYGVSSTLENIYIGDLIASTLGELYYTMGTELVSLPKISDTVFLADNSTKTTKELVVQSKIKHPKPLTNDNKYIAFGEHLDYATYIDAIMSNFTNIKINRANVDLHLQDCIKTFPLVIDYQYIKPNAEQLSTDYNTVVHVFGGGTIGVNADGLVSNKLYELTTDNKIRTLSTGHTNRYYSKFKVNEQEELLIVSNLFKIKDSKKESGEDSSEYAIFTEANKYLKNMFVFEDGILKLKLATPPSDSHCFAATQYEHTNKGADATWEFEIRDMCKDEVLIPSLKMF